MVIQAIDVLSKKYSAGKTFLALWSHCKSHGILEVNNRDTLITSAGYYGTSRERLWKERMKKLEELGFIRIARGAHQEIQTVLLLNPHKVLKGIIDSKDKSLIEGIYNTMMKQIVDYGMKDFDGPMKTERRPPRLPPPRSVPASETTNE